VAVAKKERKESEGAPAWMVTYGDMVTLLLTFFVLLLAMSEVKKEDRFIEFMQAIKKAFGYVGGVRAVPLEHVQMPRNVNFTEMLIIPLHSHDFSKARDPGVRGKRPSTRDNRPKDVYVVGGRLQFAPLSAELLPEEAARISQLAEELRGLSTRLRISGHCSRRPVDDTPFARHRDLAYQRACVVADALIAHGIDADRIVIEAAGTSNPVAHHAYTGAAQQQNDLVEILQLNEQVEEPDS
jgi:chemotaxis protein MotB